MANLRELMLRLRPAGAPGAASGAGVPSDRRQGVEHELEPIFAALQDTVRRADQIRAEAQAQAEQSILSAQARSRALVAQAALDGAATRAELAAQLRAQARAEAAQFVREAQAAAQRVRMEASARQAERVERIVGRIRDELEAGGP